MRIRFKKHDDDLWYAESELLDCSYAVVIATSPISHAVLDYLITKGFKIKYFNEYDGETLVYFYFSFSNKEDEDHFILLTSPYVNIKV